MRSLENAGTAGLTVIVAVMGIIIYQSVAAGLPAIANGELPLWRLEVRHRHPATPSYQANRIAASVLADVLQLPRHASIPVSWL